MESANGKTDNLDVSASSTLTPETYTIEPLCKGTSQILRRGLGGGIVTSRCLYGDTGYALLNPWPFSFEGTPSTESSAPCGRRRQRATFESTEWMCNAPKQYRVALPFGRPGDRARYLERPANSWPTRNKTPSRPPESKGPTWFPAGRRRRSGARDAKHVPAVSTLPVDLAGQGSVDADLYTVEPADHGGACHAVRRRRVRGGGIAFGAMDSSEADFFGLSRQLQNATGSFVAPSAASIDRGA